MRSYPKSRPSAAAAAAAAAVQRDVLSRAATPVALELLETRTLFAAPVTSNIDTTHALQTMVGFGASMISAYDKPEYHDPAFFDMIVNDLGTSMVRGEVSPLAEKSNDDSDPSHFNWSAYDPTALAPTLDFMKQAQARGVSRFLGTVWTAPAWMKTNQAFTYGGALKPDNYAEFGEYLSAVVQMAKNDYGVDLTAVSPQNEPYFVEPYSSTTYEAKQLHQAILGIGRKFAADGLSTKIVMPEDLIFEDRIKWYATYTMQDAEAAKYVGAFGVHGLQTHWPEVRDTLAPYGRDMWMTETSGTHANWEGALGLASSIMNAVGTADASSYLYWQFSDKASNSDRTLLTDGVPNPKYYAARQFYRYIRPGYVHVGTPSSDKQSLRTETYRDPKTGAMTTVILNTDAAATQTTLNFTGSNLPGSYKVFRSSSTENMVSLGTIAGGSSVTINVPAFSIVTLTSAPELTPVTPGTAMPAEKYQSATEFYAYSPVLSDAAHGYAEQIGLKIDGGADVNTTAPNGWSALITAAGSNAYGSLDTVNALLARGANVNAVTKSEGWTALHAAAANTFTQYHSTGINNLVADKVRALVAAGAQVDARDALGRTPLHWAAMMGRFIGYKQDPSVVQALIAAGADPFAKDNFGKTPTDYAKQQGYDYIVDAIKAASGTDTTPPTATIVPIAPDPRNDSVTDVDIVFSERVTFFDPGDLVLTLDGNPIDISTVAHLYTEDDQHFHVSGLGGATSAPGTYTLTVRRTGSDIMDLSDNGLAADASDTWTLTTTPLPPPPPPPPGTQSPFHGSPFAINTGGPTTIQFEDFDNGGENVAYHDSDATNNGGAAYRQGEGVDLQATTDFGGGYHVGYTRAGEWLEYSVNVATAGKYDLGFRVASTGSNATLHVEVDGANVSGPITMPNTAGWQNWTTITKSGVSLPAGNHVVRIALDAVGTTNAVANLNYFTVSPPTSPPPPPPPAGQAPYYGTPFELSTSQPVTIQAEDFDRGGEAVAYHDVESTNRGGQYRTGEGVDIEATTDAGGGYNVGYTRAGEWIEYSLHAAAAGTYGLSFRVAAAAAGATFHAEIDGANVTGPVSVPNTGAAQSWTTVVTPPASVSAGDHVLRLVMDGAASNGAVGNFNFLTVTPPNSPPPPPPPGQTPFKGTPFTVSKSAATTIQAEDFDNGGDGVAYRDVESANRGGAYRTGEGVDIEATGDAGGGYHVGYTRAGEWLEYTINVADAGTYDFGLRVSSAASGAAVHAEIDGTNLTGSLAVPNTGAGTWTTITKSGVSLSAGQHILRLAFDTAASNGALGNFNWIKFSPPAPPPPPPPPGQTPYNGSPFAIVSSGPTTIQAELFDKGGEGVAYHDTDAANTGGSGFRTSEGVDVELTGDAGGGYHVGYTKAGEWAEYTVNVAASGTYTLDTRVSSKGLGGTFRLYVDGVDKTGALQVPDTTAWNTFQDVLKTGVGLTAGAHVLRLGFDAVGASGFAGNFNYIKVTPTSIPKTLTTGTVAYVRDGGSAASNFGSSSQVQVKKTTLTGYNREGYLKFDLSGVSIINSAKLRLFGNLGDTQNASVQTQVFGSPNTSWTESGITWNTRPATGGSALSTVTVSGTAAKWYELDVTSYLKAQKAAGAGQVTLVLRNPTASNSVVQFDSDDAAGNRPEIAIT